MKWSKYLPLRSEILVESKGKQVQAIVYEIRLSDPIRLGLAGLLVAACFFGCGSRDPDDPPAEGPESGFKNAASWSAFEPSIADSGLSAKARGYYGAVFDGRYIYFAPCRCGNLAADFHGVVMRYDTAADFKSAGSWAARDAGNTLGDPSKPTVGYAGGAFDGRYIYFAPYADGTTRHARVLRFDTAAGGGFTGAASWSAFDAGGLAGMPPNSGYDGAVYDGARYVYFVPYGDQTFAHGFALRYDKTQDFLSPASWEVFYAGAVDGLDTRGYYGGAFDGRYVYFVPFGNGGSSFNGNVLRFDTTAGGGFCAAGSWSAYDASSVDGFATVGYKGAAFDGTYLYFVPFRDGLSSQHSRVLRYDTRADFKTAGSWSAADVPYVDGLTTKGYVGAVFDGRYVFFIPYQQDASPYGVYHANVLRYDTAGTFKEPASWSAFDAGGIDGIKTKGMKYGCFAGTYVYLVPYNFNDDPANNGHTTYSRRVVRYRIDTQ